VYLTTFYRPKQAPIQQTVSHTTVTHTQPTMVPTTMVPNVHQAEIDWKELSGLQIAPPKYGYDPKLPDLSDQQIDILKLVAQGLNTQEIATKLLLSPQQVNAHRRYIAEKLKTNDLIRYAIREGLV
jgi:DNA-binding NarL/FixJ family response regulator